LPEDREATGIDGFDNLIEGGFPTGSLILVAGNAGSGKTVFAAQFLFSGLSRHNERAVYVSFAEDRKTFLSNMKKLNMDFEKYENDGVFTFLDLITAREEAVQTMIQTILTEVNDINAKRLVIDPFTALMQAIHDKIDARILLHTILWKMAHQTNVTTFLISEKPLGFETRNPEVEEFVCDGVVSLNAYPEGGLLKRSLQVVKLRGTRVKSALHSFDIDEHGIRLYSLPFTQGRPLR
jgi:circadian clock protein KaiC